MPSPPSLRARACAIALLLSAASGPAVAKPPARGEAAVPAAAAPGTLLVATPQQAVELALARAPILRSAEAGREAARGERVQAGLRPNPQISFTAENFGGTGRYTGLNTPETTYSLSQRIETGGKRQARIGAAEQALALTGLDAEAVRLDLVREVVRALADDVLRATRDRVEAGREPFVQQRRAEVARETAVVALGRAERDAALALRALAVLLAAPQVAIVAARTGWFDELGPRPDPARVPTAPQGQLERLRLDGLIAQRRAELDLQRRNAIPDVSVAGGVRRFAEAGGDTAFVASVSVPLPIFDRNQGNILRAGAEVSRAEADAERGRLFLDAALADAERRLDQAWQAADVLRRTALPAAEEAAGFAREGYAAGKFALIEVLDAQRALSDVREQLNAARLEVQQVRADIVRLRGRAADPGLAAIPARRTWR